MKLGKIEIYGTENCKWCRRAKEFMELNDFPYEYINFTEMEPEEILSFVRDKAPGATTIPIILLNGKYLGGYTELREYHATKREAWSNYDPV